MRSWAVQHKRLRRAFPVNPISLAAYFNYWRRPFSELASAASHHEEPNTLDFSGLGESVLIVVVAVGASVLISRFLRSEAFRKLMGAKTGEALYSEATYSPLSWSGSSMFVDSLQATGLEGSIVKNLRADQVRADVNWRAIFKGAWRVDQIQVVSFDATFRPGSIVPKTGSHAAPSAPRSGIASWLPTRFEVGELDIGRAQIHFRSSSGVEIASLRDAALGRLSRRRRLGDRWHRRASCGLQRCPR